MHTSEFTEQNKLTPEQSNALLRVISRAQQHLISDVDPRQLFDCLLSDFLELTGSEFGFMAELHFKTDSQPYLKTHAISNIAWNEETRGFFEANAPEGLELYNLDNLFGKAITSGKTIISNDPGNDPSSAGLPDGHPPLKNFLGEPVYFGEQLLGMIGVANRPSGYEQDLVDFVQPLIKTYAQIIEVLKEKKQRQASEKKLSEREERLQQLTENIKEVFWIISADGNEMIYISPGYEDIWGRSCESLYHEPKDWQAAIHPDDIEQVKVAFAQIVDKGFDLDYRIIRPDNSISWIHDHAFPIKNETGEVYRVAGLAQNITARKTMEQTLLQSSRSFELLRDYITLTSGLSLDAIASSTLHFLKQHLNIHHSSITLLDSNEEKATIFKINHKNDLSLEAGNFFLTNDSALKEIINTKQPLYRPDMTSLSSKHAFDSQLVDMGLRSDFIMPLYVKDKCLGTLNVATKEIDGISKKARQLIPLLAPSLAHAVHNSTLFETLQKSEHKYRRLVEALRDDYFFYAHDTNGIFTYLSPSIKNVLGYTPEDFLKHYTRYHTDNPINDKVERHTELSIKGEQQPPYEVEIYHKDGSIYRLEVTEVAVFDSDQKVIAVEGIAHDITARKLAGDAVRRLNRTLSTILQIDRAMVRSKDENTLLQTVCDVLVNTGGHRMAWVGFAEHDEEKTVTPVAQAGNDEAYLNSIQISWADSPFGHGPTGTAIRTGKPFIARDIHNDPNYKPWRSAAEKHGYASSISLPLIIQGKTIGALNIYAVEADAFEASETKLLKDLADELAYGIQALRISSEHDVAEAKLRASEENYRSIFNAVNDAIFVHEMETGAIIDVNQKFNEMFGYTVEEARQLDMSTFSSGIPPYTSDNAQQWIAKAVAGQPQLFEWQTKDKSGRLFWVEVNLKCASIGDQDRVLAIVRDISERKQADLELQESEQRFQNLANEAPVMIGVTDAHGHMTFLNKTWLEFRGKTMAEEEGWAWAAGLHPEDRETTLAKMELCISQQKPYSIEYRIQDRHQEYHWLLDHAAPRFGPNGEPTGYIGTAINISTRKQTEKTIQEKMHHLDVIGRISQLCLKTNLDDMLGSVLEEMLVIFDCDRAWFLCPCDPDADYWRIPLERTKPDWPGVLATGKEVPMTADTADVFRAALQDKNTVKYDSASAHNLPAVAQQFSVQAQLTIALHVKSGKPWLLGIHHCAKEHLFSTEEQQIFYDIGQRMTDALSSLLSSAELSKSEARLAEAQRIAKVGSWELDLINNQVTWSDEVYRIFGLQVDEFGASYEAFLERVHPDDRDLVNTEYTESVKNKKPYNFVHRLLLKDGTLKYVNAKCITEYDTDDKPLRSFGTTQDITDNIITQEALKQSEEKWRSLTNFSPDHIMMLDRGGIILFINHTVPGLTIEQVVGTPISSYLPDDFKPVAQACYQRVLDTGLPDRYETKYIDQEGKLYYFEAHVGPVKGQNQVEALIVSARDITQRKKAEIKLSQMAAVVENTAEAVIFADADNNIIAINRAFTEITGYSEEEALGANPRLLRSEKHDISFYNTMWASIEAAGMWQGEIWDRRKNDEIFPAWSTISAVKDSDGNLINYVSVFSDISSIKRSQEQLDFLAHHDPLTHLPNRMLFNDRLEHALQRAQREEQQLAVFFLDLDRFKTINDSLGHPVGDALLQAVAERILKLIRKEDTVARLGGDEFIILIEEVNEAQSVAQLAQKIVQAFATPFSIDTHKLYLTVSIGISLYPQDGEENNTLIRNADAAMYRAKEEGRNDYQFYTAALTAAVFERLTLETALRHALKRDEFILYYQPQYALATGELIGAEALIRWQHPDMGLVSPAKFIPLAEECGLIEAIGEWVLRSACLQMKQWLDDGLTLGCIAVNVSGLQFQRHDLLTIIKQVLDESGLNPKYLELEITEGYIMQKTEQAIKVLDEIKQLGISISVDDFGTGYSSLSYLKRLPLDKLKIDKSFVRDIPDDPNDEAITRAIVALGQSLQLRVIAEGIETEAQKQFLKTIGCDEGQGYSYGGPLPADEFIKQIKGSPT